MNAVKLFTVIVLTAILFHSCVYHDISDPEYVNATDESLFDEANASGYVYYQSGNIIPPAAQSPHAMFKLRFDATASQALDANGEIPENGQFPNGSIIVKEVYVNSTLNHLAVMKKAPPDQSAGEGWLWAEYALDGSPFVSIGNKGSGCTGCHNDAPNRDLVRTFDLH